MAKRLIKQNNNIGSAIHYFRDTHQITQSKLCKGLCSVATLSRIEAGERDVDSLLLDTLLERLGKTPNQFELILTDFDYEIYQIREKIKKYVRDRNYGEAHSLLHKYVELADAKSPVHQQFVAVTKALLNDIANGAVDVTIDLLMQAISFTVPGFKTNQILDYYLSNSELNIIIDIIQRMVAAEMKTSAKEILQQILEYFNMHSYMQDSDMLYAKLAVIAAELYIEEGNYFKALEICDVSLKKYKGNRKLDYRGDLYFIKAQCVDVLYSDHPNWDKLKKDNHKLYLQSYYVYVFCDEYEKAELVMKHIQEE